MDKTKDPSKSPPNNVRSESSSNVCRPDVEAFTKLWSSLRNFYEGTNVTRTIARLLHIYQPEDGILVYAKLLRTLYVMLENFDPKGFCTLASMVPPPKGATEATIGKVFYDSTGHYRLNVPVLRFNKTQQHVDSQTYFIKAVPQKNKISTSTVQSSTVVNSNTQRPADETNLPLKKRKILFLNEWQKTPVKKQSDTSNVTPLSQATQSATQSATSNSLPVCSMNARKLPTSITNIKMKWTPVPISSEKKSSQTTVNKVEVTNRNSTNSNTSISNGSKIAKGPINGQVSSDSVQESSLSVIPRASNMISEKFEENSMKFFHSSLYKDMDEHERKLQREIRRDIHKMDCVVSDYEDDSLPTYNDVQTNPFEIQENLKQSLKHYLYRVKNGINCDVAEFPKTRPIAQSALKSSINSTMVEKNVIDLTCGDQEDVQESPEIIKASTSSANLTKCKETSQSKPARRKRPEPPTRPRSERVAQRNLLSQNANITSKLNGITTVKRTRSVKEKNTIALNDPECSTLNQDITSTNVIQPKYPSTAVELHKKHCCDAFMSIQRAKIAVANSLAISSVTNTHGCYPYYVNYINRHHMMQRQCMIDPFYRNGWTYQSYGQYRMPQPAHTMCCAMNSTNQKYSMVSGAYFEAISSSKDFAGLHQPNVEAVSETCPKVCPNGTKNSFQVYH